MNRFFKRSLYSSLIFTILVLFSCISQKRDYIQHALTESRQHIAAGDYKEAINRCDATYIRYPKETDLRENYIRTVEEVKAAGDAAYNTKKFDLSVEIYSVLLKSFPKFKAFEKSLSFDQDYLDRKIKMSRIAQSEMIAQNAIETDNFTSAIDAYKTHVRSYPDDVFLQEKLLGTILEIHNIAENAQETGNHILAGKAYVALSKNYQILKRPLSSLPFTETSLIEGAKHCTAALTGKGLEQYRKGKIKEAITIWEGILQFDPGNVEIKKAIDNASAHLKKIKN